MVSHRLPLGVRLTGSNRGSLAAVLAVLESELPEGLVAPHLVTDPAAWDGRGLLLYSFVSSAAGRVADELATLARRHGPGLLTVAGGPHVTGDPRGALSLGFRWVAPGEAGRSFAAFVQEVARGGDPPPGILRPGRRVALDRYPVWPRSAPLFCQVEISRGCPIGCAFCQVPALHGRTTRHRSLAALGRTFAHAVSTGHTYTRFVTPNAFAYGSADGRTANPSSVRNLLELARRSGMRRVYLGSFPSEVRPETVTEEMLAIVRDLVDNRSLVIGLQSSSDRLLAELRRGHTVEEGVRAVASVARAGFVPRVDFIFGLPGETAREREETRALIRHLAETYGAHIDVHHFSPLPGTRLARSRPGPVDPETLELVESLTGAGKASGSHRHGLARAGSARGADR